MRSDSMTERYIGLDLGLTLDPPDRTLSGDELVRFYARAFRDGMRGVLQVPEGSIVWLHNVDFAGDDLQEEAYKALHEAIGHNRFVLLCTNGDGVVQVLGADELVAKVRTALDTPGEDA